MYTGLTWEVLKKLHDSQKRGEKQFLMSAINEVVNEKLQHFPGILPDISDLEHKIRIEGLVKFNPQEQRDEVTEKGKRIILYFLSP